MDKPKIRPNFLLIFLLSASLLGCARQKLPVEMQNGLSRSTNYLNTFHAQYSRLPTRDEFWVWWKTNDIRGVDDYYIDSKDTNEYELHIWLGESALIYSSKTKTLSEPWR
jgi:hypothetical protein